MLPEAAIGDGGPHPGLHVGGGRDDLGAGHLLHLLQSLLSLGGVQVGGGALAGNLQQQGKLETLRGYVEYYNMVYRAAKNARNLFQTAKWRLTFVYGPHSDAISICYTQRNEKNVKLQQICRI